MLLNMTGRVFWVDMAVVRGINGLTIRSNNKRKIVLAVYIIVAFRLHSPDIIILVPVHVPGTHPSYHASVLPHNASKVLLLYISTAIGIAGVYITYLK